MQAGHLTLKPTEKSGIGQHKNQCKGLKVGDVRTLELLFNYIDCYWLTFLVHI